MKSVLVLSIVGLAVLVGCSNKKQDAGSKDSLANIAPPPPVHTVTPEPAPVTRADVVATPVDVAPVTTSGPARGQKYVVQRGDTLWGLATRTYGDGKQYKKIVAANPSIKGDRLIAGTTIVLP